ncbi:MAG: hypothetical protein V1668_03270 [Patescibacteria group bacterium]
MSKTKKVIARAVLLGFIAVFAFTGLPFRWVKAATCWAADGAIAMNNSHPSPLLQSVARIALPLQAAAECTPEIPAAVTTDRESPSKPGVACGPQYISDACHHFKIWQVNGHDVKWPQATAANGIHYFVNAGNSEFSSSIISSFKVWQSASENKIKFIPDAYGPIVSNPLNVSDGVNSVSFGTLTNAVEGWYQDPNGNTGYLSLSIDAVTRLTTGATKAWADPNTGLIYEADTVLNSSLSWSAQQPPPANTWYLPNTMVHEAGHWLDLADLKDAGEIELTMYYATAMGETKYATLGLGDKFGVRAIYP